MQKKTQALNHISPFSPSLLLVLVVWNGFREQPSVPPSVAGCSDTRFHMLDLDRTKVYFVLWSRPILVGRGHASHACVHLASYPLAL